MSGNRSLDYLNWTLNDQRLPFDMESDDIKNGLVFTLKLIPEGPFLTIFEYMNAGYARNRFGKVEMVSSNEWNMEFRLICKEFTKYLPVEYCVGHLDIEGTLESDLILNEQEVAKIESLRYLKCLNFHVIGLSNLPRCFNLIELYLFRIFNIKQINITEQYHHLKIVKIQRVFSLERLAISTKVELKTLLVDSCENLESIPDSLNSSLEILDVYTCALVSNVPDHLVNLKKLSVEGTNVSNISKKFTLLEKLNISETVIDSIPPELTVLTKIDCSSTTVTVIPQINDQKKLRELRIFETNISFTNDQWGNLVNLIKLDISFNNSISYIPPELTQLKYLVINFTNVQFIPPTLINLEDLIMRGCNIESIPETLINLKLLDVANCLQISSISPKFVNLTDLCVANSQVSTIAKEFVHLTTLFVNGSQVSSIPKELINLESGDAFNLPRI